MSLACGLLWLFISVYSNTKVGSPVLPCLMWWWPLIPLGIARSLTLAAFSGIENLLVLSHSHVSNAVLPLTDYLS